MTISPNQTTAVILAGGFGTRIRHLLGDLPKPMAPVAGRPFLEWVVRYLAAQKIRRIVLSTGYRAEMVAAHFTAQPVAGVCVTCVPETRPLGTAGGFLNAARSVAETPAAWLVLNGDSLALAPLELMFGLLENAEVNGAILGKQVADASRFGTISTNAAADLVSFNEKKPGAGIINVGVYLFRAAALEKFPDRTPLSFETDVFPALVAGRAGLKVCAAEAPFLDIGTPESLPLAEAFIRQNRSRLVSGIVGFQH